MCLYVNYYVAKRSCYCTQVTKNTEDHTVDMAVEDNPGLITGKSRN